MERSGQSRRKKTVKTSPSPKRKKTKSQSNKIEVYKHFNPVNKLKAPVIQEEFPDFIVPDDDCGRSEKCMFKKTERRPRTRRRPSNSNVSNDDVIKLPLCDAPKKYACKSCDRSRVLEEASKSYMEEQPSVTKYSKQRLKSSSQSVSSIGSHSALNQVENRIKVNLDNIRKRDNVRLSINDMRCKLHNVVVCQRPAPQTEILRGNEYPMESTDKEPPGRKYSGAKATYVQQLKDEIHKSKPKCHEELKNSVCELRSEIAKYRETLHKNVNFLQGKLGPQFFDANLSCNLAKCPAMKDTPSQTEPMKSEVTQKATSLTEDVGCTCSILGYETTNGINDEPVCAIEFIEDDDQRIAPATDDKSVENTKTYLKSENNQTDIDIYELQKERIEKVDKLIEEAEHSLNKLKSEFIKCVNVHQVEQMDETTGDSSDSCECVEITSSPKPHVYSVINTDIGDTPQVRTETYLDSTTETQMDIPDEPIELEQGADEESHLNTISERTEEWDKSTGSELSVPVVDNKKEQMDAATSYSSGSCECEAITSPAEPSGVKIDIEDIPDRQTEKIISSDELSKEMRTNVHDEKIVIEGDELNLNTISERTKRSNVIENKNAIKLTVQLLQQIDIRPSLNMQKDFEVLQARNVRYEEVVHTEVTDAASHKSSTSEIDEVIQNSSNDEHENNELITEPPKVKVENEITESVGLEESGKATNLVDRLPESIEISKEVTDRQSIEMPAKQKKETPKTKVRILPYLKELCDCDIEKTDPPNVAYLNELYKDKSESEQHFVPHDDPIALKSPSVSTLDAVGVSSDVEPRKESDATVPFLTEDLEMTPGVESDSEFSDSKSNIVDSSNSIYVMTYDVSSQVTPENLDKRDGKEIAKNEVANLLPTSSQEKGKKKASYSRLKQLKKRQSDNDEVKEKEQHRNFTIKDSSKEKIDIDVDTSKDRTKKRHDSKDSSENQDTRSSTVRESTKKKQSDADDTIKFQKRKSRRSDESHSEADDTIKSQERKSRRSDDSKTWTDQRISDIRTSIMKKKLSEGADPAELSVTEDANVDEYLRISAVAEKQKKLSLEGIRLKRRKRRNSQDASIDSLNNSNIDVLTVSVHYSDKSVQKAIEDLPVSSLQLLTAKCYDDGEPYKHNKGTENIAFNNKPCGDNIPSPVYLKIHPNGRYADEANDFCKSATTKLSRKNQKTKKCSKLQIQKVSVTSFDSASYKLDGTGVNDEFDCKCSVSIDELHFCHDVDELKKQTAYLKKHPEELLKFEFKENNVHILSQKAYYDNWVAYYTCPTENDSNDRLFDT